MSDTLSSEQLSDGLAFATPADWFPLRVPRERADADVLADQVAAARPGLRREAVQRMTRSLVDACATLDVLCAYATALEVPGGPLPATVVASVYPADGPGAGEMAGRMAAGGELTWFDLPAGRTARIERLQETGDGDRRVVSLVVHYIAGIPATGAVVVLTFSTPALALGRQLRQLFHQMACTLRFGPPDQPR